MTATTGAVLLAPSNETKAEALTKIEIAAVLILILIFPKVACLALVKSTGLIAVLSAEIWILVKASALVSFEGASKTAPVVAVIEAVVKVRRYLVTAAEWLPVPVSVNPSIP